MVVGYPGFLRGPAVVAVGIQALDVHVSTLEGRGGCLARFEPRAQVDAIETIGHFDARQAEGGWEYIHDARREIDSGAAAIAGGWNDDERNSGSGVV